MRVPNVSKVLMLVLCSCIAASAENLLLDEIVVRGQKEALNEESLTMREVKESPARDLGESLKQVEGINLVRKGATANDIVLRGFQRDNINVMTDGVRIHGACPNRMDSPAFHYDFAEIESVKIVKGPYDLTNPGSMAGYVNAITKKPGQGFGSDLNLTYGSYNSINGSLTGSYGSEKFDALLGGAYKYSNVPRSGDGKLITEIYAPASTNRYRQDAVNSKAYEIGTGWGRMGLNMPKNCRLDIDYSYQDAEHVLYPYLSMDANYDRTAVLNTGYKIEKVSSVIQLLSVQAYWDRVDHLMDDSLRQSSIPSATVTRSYSMKSDATTDTDGVKLKTELALGNGTLSGGADCYNRTWNIQNLRAMYTMGVPYTPLAMIPDAVITNKGVYASYELPVTEKTTLTGGARGNFAEAKADKGNPIVASGLKKTYNTFGGNVQMTTKSSGGLEVFAGLGSGNRLPDQKELFVSVPGTKNTFGNPNLQPTVNNEADLGIKYAKEKFYVNGTFFYSSLLNFINLRGFKTGAVSNITYENVDALMWGYELGSQVSLPADLFLKANLSYSEGYNKNGNRPLSEIPPLKGTAALRYDKGTCFLEAALNLAAKQTRVDTALQEAETDGWDTTDLKAGYTYKDLSVYAGVYNLFDKYYFTYLSYLRDPFASGVKVPENGRNFFVTVTYKI